MKHWKIDDTSTYNQYFQGLKNCILEEQNTEIDIVNNSNKIISFYDSGNCTVYFKKRS